MISADVEGLNEYQRAAREFAIYDSPIYPVLGLSEEAGEVMGKYAKYYRGDSPLNLAAIRKELGDVLWMVANIAADQGITLSSIAAENIDKLADRKARDKIRGEGDER